MAESKRRHQPISKGSKHTVLVEEAINDVLVVCLEVGAKFFRGVLLDVNQRNLPHGVCFPADSKGNGKPGTRSVVTKEKSDTPSSPDVDIPSSVLRHTYYQDPAHMGAVAQKYISKTFISNYKDKTVRNIRLRPRQTLCSKCKSSCYDSEKGPVSVTNKQAKPDSSQKQSHNIMIHQKHSYMSPGHRNHHQTNSIQTRAQESCSTVLTRQTLASFNPKQRRKMLLSRSISLPAIKSELKKKKISFNAARKVLNLEIKDNIVPMATEDTVTNEAISVDVEHYSQPNDLLDKKENEIMLESEKNSCHIDSNLENNENSPQITPAQIPLSDVDCNENDDNLLTVRLEKSLPATKATPFIKISIGEGTVLKIPPRLHEEAVETDQDPVSELKDKDERSDINYTHHKKLKKAMKKAKEREKFKDNGNNSCDMQTILTSGHHRKHKRKHKRKHSTHIPTEPNESKEPLIIEDTNENDPENEDPSSLENESILQRPRLLYTWRQHKGLSPRQDPNTSGDYSLEPIKKDYKLQCNEMTDLPGSPIIESNESVAFDAFDISEVDTNISNIPEEHPPRSPLDVDSYSLISDASEPNLNCFSDNDFLTCVDMADNNDLNGEDDDDAHETGPPGDSAFESIRPLMMKIQTKNVTGCDTADGRTINVGDIVWGKIQGFPWWPGRVLSISMRQKEKGVVIQQLAHVSWFGSSTMSHIQCSDLFPFLEDFKLRYNKKKKGTYKNAIKQATIAAQSITNVHQIDLSEFDL